MTDTPLPLPEGLRWIKLVCRLGRLAYDGTDPDDKPDLLPTAGKVRLASSPARLRVQEPDGRWRSVSLDDREYTIRADGELVDTEGRVGVWIPDPASELLDPRPYTLVATVTPTVGERWVAKITGETLPDVVDLVAHSETVAIPASAVPGLSSRIAALEGILAGGGGGTGSGIRSVSGTVTLDAIPGIYEVYALDAATVNGVSLAAGDAAVFRYLAGEWSWMIVGQHTTWQPGSGTVDPPPGDITVYTSAPTWTDNVVAGGGSWSTPAITGVTYSPASGSATPGQSVTVTATAQAGYQLSGTSTWTHTFPEAPVGDPFPDHQIVDTFDGYTGNLVKEKAGVYTSARSTPKGGLPWIADPIILLAQDPIYTGGTITDGVWTSKWAALNLPQTEVLVELDYTAIGGRIGIALAGSATEALHVRLRPAEAEIYRDNGTSLGKTSGWTPPTAGKMSATYDPVTGEVKLLIDDVERLTVNGPVGYTGTVVAVEVTGTGGGVDNVRIKYL